MTYNSTELSKLRIKISNHIFLWLGTPKSILGTPNWRLGCPIWAIHLLGVPNFSIWGAQLLKMVWKQIFTIPWFRCLNLQLFLKNKKKMSAILNEITKFWPNENYRIVSYKRIFSNGHYGTLGFCVHQAQKFVYIQRFLHFFLWIVYNEFKFMFHTTFPGVRVVMHGELFDIIFSWIHFALSRHNLTFLAVMLAHYQFS